MKLDPFYVQLQLEQHWVVPLFVPTAGELEEVTKHSVKIAYER